MIITLLYFLVGVSVAFGELTDLQINAATKVASCRAHCIDGFSHRFLSLTNFQCESDADCFMCWENCEMFYRSFDIWGPICNDPIVCFDGCQLACSVYKDPTKFSASSPDQWSFRRPMSIDQNVRMGYANLEWSQPVPIYSVEPPLPHVVFVLFWLNVDGWIQVNQTVATSYFTKNPDIVNDRSIKLLVLAVTRDGVVCQLGYANSFKDQQRLNDQPLTLTTTGFYSSFGNRPNNVGSSIDITFIVGTIAAAAVSVLLITFGTFFGWKILKEQRRKYLLRRANALKIKRSLQDRYQDSRSLNDSCANLLKIETISKTCQDKIQPLDPMTSRSNWTNLNVISYGGNELQSKSQVIKVDSNVPFVLSIVERPQGIDEVVINHELLKKKLEEQTSIVV